MRWLGKARCILYLLALSFASYMLLGIYLITRDDFNQKPNQVLGDFDPSRDSANFGIGSSLLLEKIKPRQGPNADYKIDANANKMSEKIQPHDKNTANQHVVRTADNSSVTINYNVHVFYYVWYGNPKNDKKYYHWNHKRLPHWDKNIAKKFVTTEHEPPDDIGANYYPDLGAYSSRDPQIIDKHMQQIQSTGAGVLSVSWYPPDQADESGKPWDKIMPIILDAAEKYRLKVCFHIEPYAGRSAVSFQFWIKYIIDTYGKHAAFYRVRHKEHTLPLFYLYDSYQVEPAEWRNLLTDSGRHTVRNTHYDALFIGLLVEKDHQDQLEESGFDGYYTYFASDGFTYGSNTAYWRIIAKRAKEHGKIFIPSIGPGYIDDRVRPWNIRNTKRRNDGRYYENSFKAAVSSSADFISITSFNEWHEGTQIERAVPKTIDNYKYLDYSPHSPDFYLQLTKRFVDQFSEGQSGV